ncbi:MAG: Tyrosine recombinase XerC [bacterium ADurb.Bin236]|nr:MAG: Tyrosine recombinase XerC [bacterium ADurb.Bin236]HPN94292.1 site-specific integrase [bacterium]
MKVNEAIVHHRNFHSANSKLSTQRGYNHFYNTFAGDFADRELSDIAPDEVLGYLTRLTEKCNRETKRLRHVQTKAFFNFAINCLELAIPNPCGNALLSKSFRNPKRSKRSVAGKEDVDSVIFRCENERDRVMIELMARSGMRIGEVLKMCPCDVEGRRITLEAPKSGKDIEYAYMTESTADRLGKHIKEKGFSPDDRIFNLSYSGARFVVKKAGDRAGVDIKPHDFRRHAATYASRMGLPLEVVSKVLLRHANLSTTQIYLGTISEADALHYMDTLHGK